jgi:actin-like ATPase involved in cell morphogenesis
MAGGGFVLGVDFGTSNTVAMLRRPGGRVTPLLFDGTPVLPSAVCATPNGLSVGRDALHHGRHHPQALEFNPKRRIDEGTVLLGANPYPLVEVIGAVFARVGHEATRVAGRRPDTLVLSHPAGWGPVRRLTLVDAAAAAGLPTPIFVPEPAAAARYFVEVLGADLPPGTALVVYDFGAGTFDVSVLRATADGVEVLGSDGLDVGGLDVDAAVVGWLRERYDAAAWARLERPATADDQRLRHDLWTEVRVAKEMLSRAASAMLRPPLLAEVPLTLAEFEQIVQPLVDRTVRTTQGLARHCGVDAAQVLLVGGSSRIPFVATALHRAFGLPPTVTEQPETVVAEGCVRATDASLPVGSPVFPVSPTAPASPVSPVSPASSVSPAAPVTSAGASPLWPPAPAPSMVTSTQPENGTGQVLPAQREPWTSEFEVPDASASTMELPAAPAGSAPTVEMPAVTSGGPAGGAQRMPPRQLRSPASEAREAAPVADRAAHARAPAALPPPDPLTALRPATSRPTTDRPVLHQPAPGARQGMSRPVAAGRGRSPTDRPPRRRGPGARLALVLISVLVLLAGGAAVLFSVYGPPGGGSEGDGSTVKPSPGPPFPTWPVRYSDPLTAPKLWTPTAEPIVAGDCAFRDNRLEIDMRMAGIFRCPGQKDALTDFALRVDVHLLDGRSCGGIWFRRFAHESGNDSGYLLKVCPTELLLGHHHFEGGKIVDFARFRIPKIQPGGRATIGISVRGGEIAVYHNDKFVGSRTDGEYPNGRVALGIAVPVEVGTGRVGFGNVEMRVPPAGAGSGQSPSAS